MVTINLNREDLRQAVVDCGYDEPEDELIHATRWINIAKTLGMKISLDPPEPTVINLTINGRKLSEVILEDIPKTLMKQGL